MHDVIPLVLKDQEYINSKNTWFMKFIKSLNSNDYYICNSEYTKQDFLKHVPAIDKNKIYTSLLACENKFCTQSENIINEAKEKLGIKGKYALCIGNIEPRKNQIRVVRTFIKFLEKNNIKDLSLVITGTNWSLYIDKVESEIPQKYLDKIILTGYVEDKYLPALYSGAEWFIYTSQYEGFGLPLLEAMSCGCPVIASNSTSLPEVVGDAGIMVDYDSDEQHIKAYEMYYFNKELTQQNRLKGIERAKYFSWKKCTNKITEIMQNVVSK